jgi:TonB family protein
MFSNRHAKSKIAWFRILRVSVIFLLASASMPCARAQQPQIDALAARVAEELGKKHEKTVVIFDFVGPDKKSTALGQKIADDFSDALKKSSAALSVAGRPQIAQALEENRLSTQTLYGAEFKLWFAKKLTAGAMVLGTLEPDGENLNIAVDSYNVKDGKALKEFKVALPLSDQMKSLIDTPADAGKDQSVGLPSPGANGYSVPTCVYCPQANFSELAVKNHTQGTIILVVVVGTDGKAHDIRVVKGIPDGLTESAIETVRSWKFKPATAPDGAPAAVKQTIEVTFHLYNPPH